MDTKKAKPSLGYPTHPTLPVRAFLSPSQCEVSGEFAFQGNMECGVVRRKIFAECLKSSCGSPGRVCLLCTNVMCCAGAGLGPELLLSSTEGWNPTGTGLWEPQSWEGLGQPLWVRAGRSPLEALRMLRVELCWHCPPSWPQVGCPCVLGSNLMLTQPWDCFLSATTAATRFLMFWGAWGWYHQNIPFLGELRYINAFWKYFPEACSRAMAQIFHDPC